MNFKEALRKLPFLKQASQTAEELNVDAFIVGGFVRDFILKRNKNEIDFLIIGDGPSFANIFANKLGIKDISIFKNFGTAHFHFNSFDLEFVGARKESYKRGSRKPDVLPGSFQDDINRRDFTINTLAVSINKNKFGELIDTFNGFKDIEKKIIKTPIDPLITFNDDPLRILRAYRFASQLSFKVDGEINSAAKRLKERLNIVSQERITDDF